MAIEHDERPLARQIAWALLAPFALLIAAGGLLALQFAKMMQDADWVDHTDEVIAKTYEAEKQLVDQETGLRGYLLTGDSHFLEPFHTAHPREVIGELARAVADNPEQLAQIEQVRDRYDAWLEASSFADKPASLDTFRTRDSLLVRKKLMDRVRTAMTQFLESEEALRRDRSVKAFDSGERARIAFIGLLGAVAVALALLSRRQLRAVSKTYSSALASERDARRALEREDWIRMGQVKLAESIRGDHTLEEVGQRSLDALAKHVGADVGAFFAAEPLGLRRRAGFALDGEGAGPAFFAEGEGVVGRAAAADDPVVIRDLPNGFLRVRSGIGEHAPSELVAMPARSAGTADAVVELGFFRAVDERTLDLLGRVGAAVSVAVRSANYRARLQDLLDESQRQSEELQSQQEELRAANEELRQHAKLLTDAQTEIEERQNELEATNASLEEQREDLERTKRELTDKAAELERVNQYKSQFLANMSHELRTPLNSALILAKLLVDNEEGNLSEEQVKFAGTIQAAGYDLLGLIDDVLDLSKIEAGEMTIRPARVPIAAVVEPVLRTFEPMAKQKGIDLSIIVGDSAPRSLVTDKKRLQQILTNLVSNAVKFTERGVVRLEATGSDGEICFEVRDTGIGIPAEQHSFIFDAFRQVDGTSARKHGGSGLGLSIARDLTHLLGGTIRLDSEMDRGSTFVVSLPTEYKPPVATISASPTTARPTNGSWRPTKVAVVRDIAPRSPAPVPDDRARLDRTQRLLLVVEDDPAFAKILVDLCHELRFQCVATDTAEEAVALAKELVPSAIVLDVNLRDHSGLSVLDRVKRDAVTRHVPVHVISIEDHVDRAKAMGAAGYLLKPASLEEVTTALRALEARLSSRMRRLLVVEDDALERASITELLRGDGTEIVAAGTVREALTKLATESFDCMVMDLKLPDGSGSDLLDQLAMREHGSFPPVIVYTGRSLTREEEARLRGHASSIIVKGARSQERLLDEVTLFLHQVESELPPDRRRMLQSARARDGAFVDRRFLVVEDDVRNVFALMNVLEPRGATVVVARNGREALAALEREPRVDLVLMDIMMPEMDGLEATRAIRSRLEWSKLPIIALTAKTMPDDQRRCLEAGANDFIAKPLDVDVLLSLLRVWMPR
jgi:CheY-like chemotaxis protein